MTFLNKLSKGETLESAKEDNILEEQYEKMFKKIARDFVTKDDLKDMMLEMLSLLSVANASSILDNEQNAIKLANEYEANLKKSSSNRKKYKDVK